jgi:predicted MFS family arabinose efflux permease
MLQQRKRHPKAGTDPLMNLSLFTDRRFAMGSIVAFIYGIALFGSTYLLPVYMQMGLRLSPSYVGSILLPAGLVLAVTIALVGRLSDRQPTHRLVSLGLLLLTSSFALMATMDGSTPGLTVPLLIAWATLGRIGLGFILPSLNTGAMRGLERHHIPQGASVINFLRMLGGAAGVSLCGIVLEWRLAAHGVRLGASGAVDAIRLAPFNETFLMLAGTCALALLAAWRLRPGRAPD